MLFLINFNENEISPIRVFDYFLDNLYATIKVHPAAILKFNQAFFQMLDCLKLIYK